MTGMWDDFEKINNYFTVLPSLKKKLLPYFVHWFDDIPLKLMTKYSNHFVKLHFFCSFFQFFVYAKKGEKNQKFSYQSLQSLLQGFLYIRVLCAQRTIKYYILDIPVFQNHPKN